MTSPAAAADIVAIGNAIVDVLASADDALLAREGLTKGQMQLIDAPRAESLYAAMGPAREVSGGSAANTLAGAAALGLSCRLIGLVADDQLGRVFAHDIRAQGVAFDVPPADATVPTGRCLILVSPDGQRTMNTYLGAATYLPEAALDEAAVAAARVLLLEGYLWDPPEPRRAMRRAIRAARAAGGAVALGVSAEFCIARHGDDFRALIDAGAIDILFANEEEVKALARTADFEAGVAALERNVPLLVATRGAAGAIAVERGRVSHAVPAETTPRVVDTTGAGDLFAAGFLAGHLQGRGAATALRMGAIAAAEVIGHFGARPEAPLAALMAERLERARDATIQGERRMDSEPSPEARVIPLGEPIVGGLALFEGSLAEARAFVAGLSPEQRAEVSIWTPGHVWTADELAAQPPGAEHD